MEEDKTTQHNGWIHFPVRPYIHNEIKINLRQPAERQVVDRKGWTRKTDARLRQRDRPRHIANLFRSHHRSFAGGSDLARRVFVPDTTCGGHQRALTLVDLALGQCCDDNLHPTPSFCTQIVVCRHASKRYTCRAVSPSSKADTDDNHIKRDADDGRDLVISNNV